MTSASVLFVIVVFALITLLYIFSSIEFERQPDPEEFASIIPLNNSIQVQSNVLLERELEPEVFESIIPLNNSIQIQNNVLLEREQEPEVFATMIPLNNSIRVESSVKPEINLIDSYENLEKLMCKNSRKWNETMYQPRKGPCPRKGIVSFQCGGRTGNLMWKYASIWAVARHTGLDPYIPGCIKSQLDQIFEQLTIPDLRDIAHCPVEVNIFVKSLKKWTSTNQNIILFGFDFQKKLALPWIRDVMQEFRFTKKLRDKAQQTLTGFIKNLPSMNYTFVGVHVRRTDYVDYLKRRYNKSLVNPQFFTNAMAYYKHKYPNCLFIYISDDPTWCFNKFGNLKDVFVASYNTTNTPAEDLAIMAACNHSIIDYGTFGEWGSILAGGKTVNSNMALTIKKAIKNWTMINKNDKWSKG